MVMVKGVPGELGTRDSALSWAVCVLAESGVEETGINAQLLLCHVLGCDRSDLLLRRYDRLTDAEVREYRNLVERRRSREPLQYILGETVFMGFRFYVDRRVLIPRPETELLVESLAGYFTDRSSMDVRILDIGTGSGNIAVSAALMIGGSVIDALEISGDAIDLARRNISYHHLEKRIRCIQGDIMDDGWHNPSDRYHVVVSNPPYIRADDFEHLQPEITRYEPRFALSDGGDGLRFYRRIASVGKHLLVPGGSLFLEIAYDMSDRVSEVFAKSGYSSIRLVKDYDHHPRILIIRE